MRTCGQSKRSLFQRNTIVRYIKQLHIWLHFFLTFHPSCRDIFGAICLVTLTQRFGELSRLRENIFTRLLTLWVPRSESHDSRLFSEPSLSPLALIAHLRLTVPSTRRFGARSKRAQLTSPVLTAVDRAPCSPTPSGAFIAVAVHRPPRPDPGRTFFTPVAFPNVSRSDGGVSRPRGARLVGFERPELTRRNPHVSPKHPQERPERLTIGRERPMDGARRPPRCAPVANFSPRRPTPRLSRTHPFSHALPSPPASPASRSRHQPLTSPHSPHSRRETSSEACARAPPPRSRQARRGDLHRCAQRPPLFHPLNLQTSRWKRVPRLTFTPAGRLAPEGAAACVSTPGASATR